MAHADHNHLGGVGPEGMGLARPGRDGSGTRTHPRRPPGASVVGQGDIDERRVGCRIDPCAIWRHGAHRAGNMEADPRLAHTPLTARRYPDRRYTGLQRLGN